jgi:hypothetical protein
LLDEELEEDQPQYSKVIAVMRKSGQADRRNGGSLDSRNTKRPWEKRDKLFHFSHGAQKSLKCAKSFISMISSAQDHSNLQSFESDPSLLSPPPTRPTTTSEFCSTVSATTRTGTETFLSPSYTATPSYTASLLHRHILIHPLSLARPLTPLQ